MSELSKLLNHYREVSQTEREKGTYFEELILCYLRNEATYSDLYSEVWTYADWAASQGLDKRDTGIDLVAKTRATDEYHAIQCKLYDEDYKLQKSDIDSFFTASGKKPFTHRIIISTTNHWSEHADDALRDQQPPVSKIDLNALENSQIDWAQYQPKTKVVIKPKKQLREHQTSALSYVEHGLKDANRGKLIMACGTGKTFTSLKIAEKLAGKGKRVLFLVPSLSLLSQTLTEWTQESQTPLHSFAVCSDSDVGKKRKKDDDAVETQTHELRYPATTKADRLAAEMTKRHDAEHMSVVFSTYHSIEVISKAQLDEGMAEFDLIICDEAHRTTGATFEGEDESAFVKIHDANFIKGKKRLYMTATPRIYGEMAKAKAEKSEAVICSMDDESLYGKELYVITFSEAVKRGLLVDYKVIILSVEETHINRRLQNLLKDEDNQLKVDDAAKIVGCWKALSKLGITEELTGDESPMQRAVAFCQVIEVNKGGKTHKVSSKQIASMFKSVVDEYIKSDAENEFVPSNMLACEAEHVDGSMNASEKEDKINWLKAETPDNTCRILSNVRCLSEGVDVPALDAVLFLTPRNSQIDVVQSVGRVMRNSPNKKRGYVILPVVIPAGVEPHEALNDNKTYSVVWQVLQALRSHDDRFDAMVNKLDLIGKDSKKMEVIAITDKIAPKQKKAEKGKANKDAGKGGFSIGSKEQTSNQPTQGELQFEIGEVERAIYAKLVQKVGNRHHWEDWANDIAKIANTHIDRIKAILESEDNQTEKDTFNQFAKELRSELNDSLSNDEIIEMLAQHLITKPVFDALFSDYEFAKHNPMSQAMQGVLDVLAKHNIGKEADTLQQFYDSVKMRAEGIDSAAGKQKIIVELYDKFFSNAFPEMRDRLGIVYTPVEVVDFIIHSINHLLQKEFNQTLGSKNVHIIDPFTGTGTFVTRLLQSGLITPEQLPHKYKHEIHANEIVLLAYYIAAINIEAVYHGIMGGKYHPFEGICLTDTFQMYEREDLHDQMLAQNNQRRKRQKELDIRVIMGNPPYSAGQGSANDNNANVAYPTLDASIRDSYAKHSNATSTKNLMDSYIRSLRWASDRVGKSGIIGFVSNASFVDSNSMDGLRKCLKDEFSSIYIFHLRGNQRTSGELSRREGGKIFGSGSRTPVAISLLVKNPEASQHGQIRFYDIGDYLSREQKLEIIANFKDVSGIEQQASWSAITPDEHNDWLNQRDDSFGEFISLGDKKTKNSITLFDNYSLGLGTNRDAWCYNSSKNKVLLNMKKLIGAYNKELAKVNADLVSDDFLEALNSNPTEISWSSSLISSLKAKKDGVFRSDAPVFGGYRPFQKTWVYFDQMFNHRVGQMPKIFPNSDISNRVICVTGRGETVGFSTLITDVIPNLHTIASGQCFPLKLYEPQEQAIGEITDLFADPTPQGELYTEKDGISDAGLKHFKQAYPSEQISKEDIFYYVYGLLHSEDYRSRYADNLSKELPRIPCVKTAKDFWAFSQSGRQLAELHINYEQVEPYAVSFDCGKTGFKALTNADFRVEKMKFGKGKAGEKHDKTTVIYNHKITMTGIPLAAYDYIVNGKPALEWVMERQAVTTHKESGIVNDANDWANETMNNPRYPLELFQRVITVSMETMKIVKKLPRLDID